MDSAAGSEHREGKGCCTPARGEVGGGEAAGNRAETIAGSGMAEVRRVRTSDTRGMKLVPGGEFLMGNERDYGFAPDGEGPVHAVVVAPFYLDATTVTNEQFNDFVNATGYKTEAERFGWSFVFEGDLNAKQLANAVRGVVRGSEWWCRVDGATWRHPEGPGSNIKQRWKHPVVHVSWNDAVAYAGWAGKRLPTEAEWGFAARGGLAHENRFPWGDELEPDGRHRMNVWQGVFPSKNTAADGHAGVAPAQSFKPNAYGLYQMTGNVWEWCADWFDAAYYRSSPKENPAGPAGGSERVMRGGSYLCHASYCNRYRVDARNRNAADTGTTNIGFRCASDV